MRTGKLISVDQGPKRDVTVRIAHDELLSEISDPPGPIKGADVTSYHVAEEQCGAVSLLNLYLETATGRRIRFYTADDRFDIALLLDELEASLGNKPRTWIKG
jgi:hypothetical protein